MKPNLASVPWHQIKSWRQEFWVKQKRTALLLCQAKGPQPACASKTVCLNMEATVRSFMVMVQRGCDQLADTLLIGWWWGKWESASSTFWFPPIWGLPAWGQHTIDFSHLVGLSVSAEQLRYCYTGISLNGERGPCPEAAFLFLLTVPPLSPQTLPSLISNCLNLLTGTQGRSWRLNEAYFLLSRRGGHRKAFVPRSPTGSCSVSTVHNLEIEDSSDIPRNPHNFELWGSLKDVCLRNDFASPVSATFSLGSSKCLIQIGWKEDPVKPI